MGGVAGERLIPGDVGVLRLAADGLVGLGERCEAVAAGLGRVDSDAWTGSAGEAFRARLARVPGRWRQAADAFATAGRAVRGFAMTLQDAQDRAVAAVGLYRQAEQVTAQARAEYEARQAAARAGLGPAAAAANLVPFVDPGEPLRVQALAQAAAAEADVAAAAEQTDRALTAAALAAPEPAGATTPEGLGSAPRIGGVLANGPDGSAWIDHRTVVPVTAPDEMGAGSVTIATTPAPAGTMIPTAGITDRQTLSEPGIPTLGQPPPSWQANIEDAAYARYHDIAAELGLPVVVVAEVVNGTYEDLKTAVTNPNLHSIAMAAADLTPAGKPVEVIKAAKAVRDAERIEHDIKDAGKVEHDLGKAPTAENAPDFSNPKIDHTKITDYAMNPNHPIGKNKYRVIKSATGLNERDAELIERQIREGVRAASPIAGKADQYGQRWAADITLSGPKGTIVVRTAWILDADSSTPRLITISFPE